MKTIILFVAGILMISCNNTENTATTVVSSQSSKPDSNANSTQITVHQNPQPVISNAHTNQTNKPTETSNVNTSKQSNPLNEINDNYVSKANSKVNTATTSNFLRENFNTVVVKEKYSIPISNATTTISTKKGSVITIKTSDLVTESGKSLTAPVEVKVMEMKNSFDMLAMHSPTVSDNQILESGGSWYIDATSNGEAVKLKDGKSYKLESAIEVKPGFSLFYGEKKADGTINWKPANTSFVKSNNTNNGRVGLMQGIKSTVKAKGLKIDWGCFGGAYYDDHYYDMDGENYFSYWVEKGGINQICSEVWEFNKNDLSRKKIMDNGFRMEDVIKSLSYGEFTDAQKKYLLDMLQNAECIDRARVFDKNSKDPINYEFIIERNNSISQFVIDSIVVTNNCKTLPIEMKKIIEKKIDKYCKENYSKIFNEYLVQLDKIKVGIELNNNEKMFVDVNKFGWINCDRFYNTPAEKIICKTNIINKEQSKGLTVYLVFKNINSLISANKDEQGNYDFNNIPVGEDVMAVALGSDGTNSFFGSSGYTKVQKNVPLEFSIAKVSNDELKGILKNLKN